jgi:Lipase (class 3)
MNSIATNTTNTNTATATTSNGGDNAPTPEKAGKADRAGSIVLPTGAVMSETDFNLEIDRMFDFKRTFQDAFSKGKSILTDEINVIESAFSSFHEASDDEDDDDDEADETPQEPTAKRFRVRKSSASKSPDTVVPSSPDNVPHPAPAPPKAAAAATVVPERPSPALTGVPFETVSICATMCDQIYYATSLADFDLTHPDDPTITAEPVLFDNHGALQDVVPPFAVAIKDGTMILAWRGSASIMDWVSDAGYAPATSSRWNKASSSNVRAHSAYASFVESDLSVHETGLMDMIRERNIDTLLLTGHSLAGGMAHVAHLALEGQLQTKGSLWHPLQTRLTVRSVAFAAPMTALINASADSPVDDKTRTFLAKIAAHSCNLVYGPDIVPHGAGDITYSIDVANALVPEALKVVPYNWVMRLFGVQRKVNDALGNFLNKDGVRALAKVMVQYQHVGTVVYYPVPTPGSTDKSTPASSSPVAMRDCQFLPDSVPEFRGNELVRVPAVAKAAAGNATVAVSEQLKVAHSFLMESFAYNKVDA